MSDNISNICIMNLFKCECRVFSIDHISKKELVEYYNLLKNEYDSTKERKMKKSKMKDQEYPQFIKSIQSITTTKTTKNSIQNQESMKALSTRNIEFYFKKQ